MTTSLLTAVRRAAVVAASASALVAVAGPVSANVPEGWSDPDPMSAGHLLLLIAGLPILLAVVITVLTVLPGLLKGEGLTGGQPTEWIGGPRQGTHELAGPDDESSEAGGVSARF
ncbi:MAG TPA: hypothetical protein VGE38_16070 [Nocardioides sp.]|uniref:hypothetical protein n=1 Tax=Nocardioides sp. TaxID=35761 RepID=UPI002ED96136